MLNKATTTSPMASNTSLYEDCEYYHNQTKIEGDHLKRIVTQCVMIVISLMGNVFFLYCLYRKGRLQNMHIITLHLCLADLWFTVFVAIFDTVWQVTFWWYAGDFMCKVLQVMKQVGMNISSFMVVVIAVDQSLNILLPYYMSHTKYKKRLLLGAWITSGLCAIPAAVFFGDWQKELICKDGNEISHQCVEFKYFPRGGPVLHTYHGFTMATSFVIPFLASIVSYILLLKEIRAIQLRERKRLGQWVNTTNIMRKTYIDINGHNNFSRFLGPILRIGDL